MALADNQSAWGTKAKANCGATFVKIKQHGNFWGVTKAQNYLEIPMVNITKGEHNIKQRHNQKKLYFGCMYEMKDQKETLVFISSGYYYVLRLC